jgi:hypothetical protein
MANLMYLGRCGAPAEQSAFIAFGVCLGLIVCALASARSPREQRGKYGANLLEIRSHYAGVLLAAVADDRKMRSGDFHPIFSHC